jgi:hypothetical protein
MAFFKANMAITEKKVVSKNEDVIEKSTITCPHENEYTLNRW